MWTLLRAPPAPRTPWAVRRRPSLPGPERVSWLAPTPSCPLSSSPQWTSPQLRLTPHVHEQLECLCTPFSGPGASRHPPLPARQTRRLRPPRRLLCAALHVAVGQGRPRGWAHPQNLPAPPRETPQAPRARLRPSPRPLATTPPCSSLASRCPSVHPFGPWDALLMPRCTQLSSGSSQGSPQGGTSGCQLSARCPGVLVLLWLCTCRVLTVESLGQHDTFCADGGCARPPQRSPCAPPPRGRRTSPCCGRDVCDARCVAY